MAESNAPDNSLAAIIGRTIERQRETIRSKRTIIAVHDNEQIIETFKQIAATDSDSKRLLHVFDNVDACFDFVLNEVSCKPSVEILIFIGGGLVRDVVTSIHACDQVMKIIIVNKPPFDKEERELMKTFPKVIYIAEVAKTTDNRKRDSAQKMEENRSNELTEFVPVFETESDKHTLPYEEPVDRSCKRFNANFAFRYSLLLCLLNAPPFPSDQTDLIELLETKGLVHPRTTEPFKRTYTSNNAIHFYTEAAFIYEQLNNALRTSNISHLILFRFYIQDMFDQLCELMAQQTDAEIFTVYRGQQSSTFEVTELIVACKEKSPIVINSFFSTSRERDCAVGFLHNKDLTLFDSDRKPVLFKITVEKQSTSRYFPFADISRFSTIPKEAEVLFAPGQMFTITKFDILHQDELNIFFFEMTLRSESDKNFTMAFEKFQNIWAARMNDPLLYLGDLLVDNRRLDEARELYSRLLVQGIDREKKLVCYQGLYSIAMEKNDTPEAMRMLREMVEAKVGSENLSTDLNLTLEETDHHAIDNSNALLMSMQSQLSSDRPLDELISYMESGEYRDTLAQIPNQYYTYAMMFMKNGKYDLAITYFETVLGIMKISIFPTIVFDPLLKAKYYMQLGHCYRELNLNDKALENYQSAVGQNIHLPAKEYVETLIGIAKASEATKDYREALTRYTEVDEIYKNDATIVNAEERSSVKEVIERLTLFLTPADGTCEIS